MSKQMIEGYGFSDGYSSCGLSGVGWGSGSFFIDEYTTYRFENSIGCYHKKLFDYLWYSPEEKPNYPYTHILKESHYKHE